MKISVVMSVYNGEKYLAEAIDSILAQTYKDFEFIIVNDCSKDNSLEIIKKYSDSRIVLINNEKNLGLTKSLNLAIEKAQGDYIARMDADDISLPNRFEIQMEEFHKIPNLTLCGTWAVQINEKGEETGEITPVISNAEITASMIFYNQFVHSTVIFNKKNFFEAGGYNEEIIKGQDYNLWLQFIKNGYELKNIDKLLVKYRDHVENISKTNSSSQNQFAVISIKDFIKTMLQVDINEKEINSYREIILNHKKVSLIDFLSTMKSLNKIRQSFMKKFQNEESISYFNKCIDIIINTQFSSDFLRKLSKSYLGF